MRDLFVALIIGIVAGTIDIIPMLIQKLEKRANISAFIHYLALGLIIPFVDWDMAPWLKGLIIAELTTIPVMIIVTKEDFKPLIPMFLLSALLGMGIGVAGDWLIG